MGTQIPDLTEDQFRERLGSALPAGSSRETGARLYAHFQELRRWNPKLALIGSGVADRVVERLFGESLAALPLIGDTTRRVLDVGSGAGFPGLVIAAARPEIEVVLVEPRERKWAFLRAAAAAASLSCVCLNARVSAALPPGIPRQVDRVTVRALKLGPREVAALSARLAPGGSFLIWTGSAYRTPTGLRQTGSIDLGPSRGAIHELVVAGIESA